MPAFLRGARNSGLTYLRQYPRKRAGMRPLDAEKSKRFIIRILDVCGFIASVLVAADLNAAPAGTTATAGLSNISTRMEVLANDNVLIAGFIVTGPSGSTKK